VIIKGKLAQPDFLYIANQHLEIIGKHNVEGAPDWVVEVLSPTSVKRDFEIKKKLYRENGVKEYWVISPEAKVVWVFKPDNPGGEAHGKGELEPAVLPQLKISVASLFT
jgi:Uma2 family endonuclease